MGIWPSHFAGRGDNSRTGRPWWPARPLPPSLARDRDSSPREIAGSLCRALPSLPGRVAGPRVALRFSGISLDRRPSEGRNPMNGKKAGLGRINPHILGQRLAEARKAKGITQGEAAAHLECSRPTYIAIEKGERPAKAEEIVKLAAFFGKRVHELVLQSEPVADLQPHLRAVAERMQAGDD